MNWLDVAGPPGSGKSTLCDVLWGPHALPIEDRLPPAAWHDWLNEITRLFHLIKPHPTFPAALRMVNRSVRKIATVARMPVNYDLPEDYARRLADLSDTGSRYNFGGGAAAAPNPRGPYIQTALVQRGLGFGWRLNDMGRNLNELRHYFRLMPVSLGVAVTRCPADVVEARNHARKLDPRTAHEDRAHMVRLMQPAVEIAIEVLRGRGVAVLEVDTTQPVDQARERLIDFARVDAEPCDGATLGSGCQDPVLSPPPWWQ